MQVVQAEERKAQREEAAIGHRGNERENGKNGVIVAMRVVRMVVSIGDESVEEIVEVKSVRVVV